jgi:hypothetical protein
MKRVAEIENGYITNVSIAGDDWQAPQDGSMMLESDALTLRIPRWTPPAAMPDIESWRVKAWLGKTHQIGDAEVEAIIEAQAPDLGTRLEWIARWRNAPMIPFENDLVPLISAGLNLDHEQVWSDIAAFG